MQVDRTAAMQPPALAALPLRDLLRPELGILATAIVDLDRRQVLASVTQDSSRHYDLELLSELPRDLLSAAADLEAAFLENAGSVEVGVEGFEEVVLHAEGVVIFFLASPGATLGLLALLAPEANVGTARSELRALERQLTRTSIPRASR